MILAAISSVGLIHLAIWLCIVALFVVLVFWLLSVCGVTIPPPVRAIIGVIVLLLVLLIVLQNFAVL